MVEQPADHVMPVAAGGRDALGSQQMSVAVARELVARARVPLRPIPTIVRNVVGGQQQGDTVCRGQPRGVDDILEHSRIETRLAWPGETLRPTLAGVEEHTYGVEATHMQPGEDGGDIVVAVDSYGEAAILQLPIFG